MQFVVRAADARISETPNALMTTLASPSLGQSQGLALWRVEMAAGQQGPLHSFDREQIWTVENGTAVMRLPEQEVRLNAGDTIVLPADVERQITAPEGLQALVVGQSPALASAAGREPATPAWIA